MSSPDESHSTCKILSNKSGFDDCHDDDDDGVESAASSLMKLSNDHWMSKLLILL